MCNKCGSNNDTMFKKRIYVLRYYLMFLGLIDHINE